MIESFRRGLLAGMCVTAIGLVLVKEQGNTRWALLALLTATILWATFWPQREGK